MLKPSPYDARMWRTSMGRAMSNVPHVLMHSPDGFEWGYSGSGPTELARCILLQYTDERVADKLKADFRECFIAKLPPPGGVIARQAILDFIALNA